MPGTKKQRPGHARLVRTLVKIGAVRQLAYDLGEDARAMVASAVGDKLDELKTVLTRRIDDQGKRIEDQSGKLGTIESFLKQLRRSLERSEVRQTKALEALEARQTKALGSLETRQTNALEALEARHTNALESFEERWTDAQKASEARLAAPYNRLVDHLVKSLWTIIATVVLAGLTVIANQVKQLLGF